MLPVLLPLRASGLGAIVWRPYLRVLETLQRNLLPSLLVFRSNSPRNQGTQNLATSRCFTRSCHALNQIEPQTLAALSHFKSTIGISTASHEINELTAASIGTEVVLHGYLGSRVDVSKKLSFVPLLSKDLLHSIQIVSFKGHGDSAANSHSSLKSLNQHTPVLLKGILKAREPAKNVEPTSVQRNNEVEVELSSITRLNSFPHDQELTAETVFTPDKRHLQIRSSHEIRNALRFRSEVSSSIRNAFCSEGFVEVETPLLFKSSPEGAREFLVPTRHKTRAYALPQSPQQYKQILMASGIPKYFQIARCFRDEDLRADRQPEFTQVDMEMSFADGKAVMDCMERLIRELWRKHLQIVLPGQIPVLSYNEAMTRYGSDKPDVRLGMEIINITDSLPSDTIRMLTSLPNPTIEAIKLNTSAPPAEMRCFINSLLSSPRGTPFHHNLAGPPGVFIYDPSLPLNGLSALGFSSAEQLTAQFSLEPGNLLILQARETSPFTSGSTSLGRLRLVLHKAAVEASLLPRPTGFEFLWINEFPLFEPASATETGQHSTVGLRCTHHPFTAPLTAQDVDRLASDPFSVRADHYDLVVNGVELGGGSRRIHNATVQEYVLRDVLQMPPERVEHFRGLIECLRAGCPPHAGMALGFDRLLAVMLGKESVRDVIAFPKSGSGEDILVGSPGVVTPEEWGVYGLKIREGHTKRTFEV